MANNFPGVIRNRERILKRWSRVVGEDEIENFVVVGSDTIVEGFDKSFSIDEMNVVMTIHELDVFKVDLTVYRLVKMYRSVNQDVEIMLMKVIVVFGSDQKSVSEYRRNGIKKSLKVKVLVARSLIWMIYLKKGGENVSQDTPHQNEGIEQGNQDTTYQEEGGDNVNQSTTHQDEGFE
ncbi:hypothetical protein L2E82_13766 [Cichorium intybus]|uniref:Uncharacterized protein n=1 Tax=Cichorium intybus TaxID=13427 RepID=A0ACB9EXT2_CICIN|nr:hypothetical protein L2E82_13766 [Cichorium intybus]